MQRIETVITSLVEHTHVQSTEYMCFSVSSIDSSLLMPKILMKFQLNQPRYTWVGKICHFQQKTCHVSKMVQATRSLFERWIRSGVQSIEWWHFWWHWM